MQRIGVMLSFVGYQYGCKEGNLIAFEILHAYLCMYVCYIHLWWWWRMHTHLDCVWVAGHSQFAWCAVICSRDPNNQWDRIWDEECNREYRPDLAPREYLHYPGMLLIITRQLLVTLSRMMHSAGLRLQGRCKPLYWLSVHDYRFMLIYLLNFRSRLLPCMELPASSAACVISKLHC